MQTFTYPYLPDELSLVNLWLFREVQNAAQLRTRLQQASLMEGSEGEVEREKLNFGFLDASKICSLRHVLTATHQALLSAAQGSLRTPTTHSEILWNLSPSTNIADAYRAFGLNPSTQSVVLIRIGPLDAGVRSGVESLIQGQLAPLSSLGSPETIDWAALRKHFKLNGDTSAIYNSKTATEERKRKQLESAILGASVLKSAGV